MEIWCHYEPLIFVGNVNTSVKSVKPLKDKTNATNEHCKHFCLFCQMFVFRRHWQNEKKVLEWSEIVAITTPCTQSTKSPISLIWSIADKNSVEKKTWKRSKPNGKIAYGMRIVNKNLLLFSPFRLDGKASIYATHVVVEHMCGKHIASTSTDSCCDSSDCIRANGKKKTNRVYRWKKCLISMLVYRDMFSCVSTKCSTSIARAVRNRFDVIPLWNPYLFQRFVNMSTLNANQTITSEMPIHATAGLTEAKCDFVSPSFCPWKYETKTPSNRLFHSRSLYKQPDFCILLLVCAWRLWPFE